MSDMKRFVFKMLLAAICLTFGVMLHSQASQLTSPLRRHWTETESETLWTVRYTNCDYGYYVLLGSGVVGHDTLPPAPNHGFLITLPDNGRTSTATDSEERNIWVDASYDVIDDQSLTGAVSYHEQIMKDVRGKPEVIKNTSTKLAGLQAVLSRVEYTTPKGIFVEETIICVRSGIIYTISLRTLLKDITVDEEQFQKIVNGFRLLKLPQGECSNG
jgi:hypothetical protein